eukprot:m.231229 g.231229  ORF g.231229 m.231229 type:complete len:1548 (-) comp17363_c0_seq1:115-4758(-)
MQFVSGAAVLLLAACAFANPPSGFTDETVLNVDEAMSMAFLDNDRVLIAKRTGNIVIADLTTKPPLTENYLNIPGVDTYGERGCMSMVLDPNYPSQPYVYIYYSSSWGGSFRVSRFTHNHNVGGSSSRGDLNSEVVIWEDPDGYIGPFHYGGDISFGPDNHIYITLGDKYYPQLSQDMNYAAGKVIRVSKTGTFPSDNMGVVQDGPGGQIHDGIWAKGLRNGYRSVWDLQTNRFFIAEVGGNNQAVAEEDLHLGKKDVNYGWPLCEGACNNPDFQQTCSCSSHDDPVYHYTHKDSNAPTGSNAALIGGFVNWKNQFPSEYHGAYFIGDYSRNWIKYLKFNNNGQGEQFVSEHMFDSYVGAIIGFEQAPDGSFFYATMHQIHHVSYTSGNQFPIINFATASPMSGSAPLTVSFSASATDPENQQLTYTWLLGNGQVKSGSSVSNTFYADGTYNVYVQVSDGTNQILSDEIEIEVGTPPVVNIVSPSSGQTFLAGQVLNFECQGTAGNGGFSLPDSAHDWKMLLLHDDHTHPAVNSVKSKHMSFTIPTTGHGFTSSVGYRVFCTVTDNGLSTTEYVDIWPQEVDLTFQTSPAGLSVFVDGIPNTAPATMDTLIGFQHQISVKSTVCKNGVQYKFDNWDDGSNVNEHSITVPGQDKTYVATYYSDGVCMEEVPVSNGLVMHLSGDKDVQANGQGQVIEWKDQEGSNHLAPVLGLGSPTLLGNGLNGHAIVSFDGNSQGLGKDGTGDLPIGNSARSVFVVVNYQSAGWGGFSWGSTGCGSLFGATVASGAGMLFIEDYCPVPAGSVMGTGEGWMIQTIVYDGTDTTHYKDGTLFQTINGKTYSTTNQAIRMGIEHSGGTKVQVQYAELAVFDRAVSQAEREQIEQYLLLKYFDTNSGPTDVTLTFASSPVGIDVVIEGTTVSTPSSIITQPGAPVLISAPASYCQGSTLFVFDYWTSSSSPTFELVAPGQDATYTAVYTPTGSCGGSSSTSGPTTTTGSTGNGNLPVTNGLVMRLYAAQGLLTDNSGAVTHWEDQSGNGNHLDKIVDAPMVHNGQLNGHGVVVFDGVDDILGRDGMSNIPTGGADRSLFMVVKYDSAGYGGLTFGSVGCNSMWGLTVTPSVGEYFIDNYCSASPYASGTVANGAGWAIHAAIVKNGQLFHYAAGQLLETLDASGLSTTDLKIRLGAEHNDNSPVSMSVADILHYDYALSNSERQQLESYLTQRYLASGPEPTWCDLTLDTVPSGMTVTLDGDDKQSPHSAQLLSGSTVSVSAAAVHCVNNVKYTFSAWSNGVTLATQFVNLPEGVFVLNAIYQNDGACDNSNPDQLPVQLGLVLHLDADDITDVNNNDKVNNWPDSSSANTPLEPVSGNGKPAYVANALNGHAVVSFDGNNDALGRSDSGNLPSGNADRTIVTVVKYDSAGWGGFTVGAASCMGSFGPTVSSGLGNLMVETFCTNDQVQSGSAGDGAGWLIQTVVLKNGDVSHYKNSQLLETFSATFNTPVGGQMRLGVEINGGSKVEMSTAAIAAWNRALAPSEVNQIVQHFAQRYQITV